MARGRADAVPVIAPARVGGPHVPSPSPPPRTAPRRRFADLGRRTASAAILVPLALAATWIGGIAFAALVALAAALMAREWRGLSGGGSRASVPTWMGLALAAACGLAALGSLAGALGLLAVAAVALAVGPGRPATRGMLAAGVPYVGLPAVSLIWLRDDAVAGLGNVVFVLLVVWAADIAGYAVGRVIGGPLLMPSVSPGKTWSGAVGALAAALAAGAAVLAVTGRGSLAAALGVAAALGIAAQLGDLLESWIKRRAGVKDSGSLIPGHGGLLDRLDGLLAAAAVAALIAARQGRGVSLWQ